MHEKVKARSLRQTIGLAERLLKLAGPEWSVTDFSSLSLRQTGLKVAIPYRPTAGALHLLIDVEPVRVSDFNRHVAGVQVRIAILTGYTCVGNPVPKAMA